MSTSTPHDYLNPSRVNNTNLFRNTPLNLSVNLSLSIRVCLVVSRSLWDAPTVVRVKILSKTIDAHQNTKENQYSLYGIKI